MTALATLKVKWSAGAFTTEVPPGVVTVTSTVAAASAGEMMEIEVEELTTRPVPAVVPNLTTVAPVKPVPVTVTGVPPAVGPRAGAHAGDGGNRRGGEGELVGRGVHDRGAPRRGDGHVDGGGGFGRRDDGDRGGGVDHQARAGGGAELHHGGPGEARAGDRDRGAPGGGPRVGLTPVTVGTGGALKVNWSAGAFTTEVPPGVVTVTSTVAAASAGEMMRDARWRS